jgi:class 3 adenylate cyclase
MLFSDIEGSTALLGRLGERYAEALSAQRALLREEFDACGGRELGTEGDSFFVVFESASDAVRCCIAAQRALASHEWPEGAQVRVRMGLHSGEPARLEDGYVGMDVHRAARAALSWSLDDRVTGPGAGDRAAIGLRLVQSPAPFWYRHGQPAGGTA